MHCCTSPRCSPPLVVSDAWTRERRSWRETVNSWQAAVSLTLTQHNEEARGEAYLSTSVWIPLSEWCVPVKWSSGLSDMTLVSLWHMCSQLTVIGVDGPHSTQPARHSYFDPLFFYFCPPRFPVFCLLATSNQSLEMEAGPSATGLLGIRSWDEMKAIMGTRQLGGHLTSQVRSDIWDFSLERDPWQCFKMHNCLCHEVVRQMLVFLISILVHLVEKEMPLF